MFVGVARFELRLPGCTSLKEKRSALRGLTGLIKQRFNAAVAEVDHQDQHQRATIGVSVIADTKFHVQRVLHEVERHVETYPRVDTIDVGIDLYSPE
ncbi:MAG: DUF503 domain-containing protein [Actinomycetota bacterium]